MEQRRLIALIAALVLWVALPLTLRALAGSGEPVTVEIVQPEIGPTATGTIRRIFLPVTAREYQRLVGDWAGITGRGFPTSFNVQQGSLRWYDFKLTTSVVSVNCGFGTFTYSITVNTFENAIANNRFTYTSPTYAFGGQFTSGWTAGGTYAFNNYPIPLPGSCYEYLTETGTWTAAWEPPGE